MAHFSNAPYIETLELAAKSLLDLKRTIQIKRIDPLELLQEVKGLIAVTGFGKSGIVARKLVATLNSISIPSIFINASDATHGDIGVLKNDDALILISKNGSSPDLISLHSIAASKAKYTLLITCNEESVLADKVDSCVVLPIDKEADDYDLVPTHSTLCQMAFCDALAIGLMKERKVTKADFGANHPSGNIGAMHFCYVRDLLDELIPKVKATASIPEVITSISKSRKGATVVIENDLVQGIITDGDLRRMLESNIDITSLMAKDVLTKSPQKISADALATEAYTAMSNAKIHQLLVMKENQYVGLIHIHQLIAKGIN